MKYFFDLLADRLEGVSRRTWISLGVVGFVAYFGISLFKESGSAAKSVVPITISELGAEIKLLDNGYLEVAETIRLVSNPNSHGIIRRYRSEVLEPRLFRAGIDFIFTPEIIEKEGVTGVRIGSSDLSLNDGETHFTLIFKTKPILEITPTKETLTWNLTNRISTSIDKAWVRITLPDYMTKESINIDAVSKLREVSLIKASTWGESVTETEDRSIAQVAWEGDSKAAVVATRKLSPGEDIVIALIAPPLTFKVISDS